MTDTPPTDHPIILFDGVCTLCNATVQFVIKRDREQQMRFAALQSDAARAVLDRADVPDPLPDSIVLIDERGVHTRSTAVIRIAMGLGFPYALLGAALIVPRGLRDAVYAMIARRRYRWFGQRDVCMVPTPDLRARFLDADEPRPTTAGKDDGANVHRAAT